MSEKLRYLKNGMPVEMQDLAVEWGFIVRDVLCDPGTGKWYPHSRSYFVSELFKHPPTHKLDDNLENLKEEIKEADSLLREVHNQIQRAQLELAEIKERCESIPTLQNVFDFIDGKVTHYVHCNWGRITITKFCDEKAVDWNGGPFHPKLLTLFGKSDGNLEWNLNQYCDGAGPKTSVVPCKSYEDAMGVARRFFAIEFQEEPCECVVQSAEALGIRIPKGYLRDYECKKYSEWKKSHANHSTEASKYKELMDTHDGRLITK